MNAAHVHLLLNHIPVLGTVFGLLILAYGVIRKSDEIKKLGFVFFVLIALVTIPVYLTGEPAEHYVEDAPGVSHDAIEEHEEAALFSFIGMEVLGVIGLVGLVVAVRTKAVPNWAVGAALIVALIGSAVVMRTAHLGGLIRHPEIGATGSPAATETATDH